jgi:hypothetical protein
MNRANGLPEPIRKGDAMSSPDDGLPEILGHAYDVFEVIRRVARAHEDQSPDLFAAFMSAAVAAADGRDAVFTATVLPAQAAGVAEAGQPAPGAGPLEAADWIADSAAALAIGLNRAAEHAQARQDRRACHDAAAAARQVHDLMTPADDDAHAG